MAFETVTYHLPVCDRCRAPYRDPACEDMSPHLDEPLLEEDLRSQVEFDGWLVMDRSLYCPPCSTLAAERLMRILADLPEAEEGS